MDKHPFALPVPLMAACPEMQAFGVPLATLGTLGVATGAVAASDKEFMRASSFSYVGKEGAAAAASVSAEL